MIGGTIIVLLLFLAVAVVAWFWPQKILCVDSGQVTAQVMVVLGGGSQDRPEWAAQLYGMRAAPLIIITGQGDDLINWRVLRDAGVPAAAIQIENKSATTRQNAIYTIKLLRARHVHSVILVTSWYHSRRAWKTFEHYAPEIKFYSRPAYFGIARSDWNKTSIHRRMRLEFFKLAGYWLRYGINPF